MNNTEFQNAPQYQEEETLDLKVLVIKILSYWYLFVIGVIVALALGYLYNRYTPSVYQTSASVFVKEDKMGIDPTSMMTGLIISYIPKGHILEKLSPAAALLLEASLQAIQVSNPSGELFATVHIGFVCI